MLAGSYRRVATSEATAAASSHAATTAIQQQQQQQQQASVGADQDRRQSPRERLADKVVAALWVAVAMLLAYVTNFFHVLLSSSSKAHHGLLQLAAVCLGANFVLFLYLTVYLPRCKGLTDSSAWEVYCPRVIPTSTLLFVIMYMVLIRATWPVWGFLAPFILATEGLGLLYATHFVPWPF